MDGNDQGKKREIGKTTVKRSDLMSKRINVFLLKEGMQTKTGENDMEKREKNQRWKEEK